MQPIDRELRELAAGQHGVVTYRQARQHGLSAKAVRWRVEAGDWERCHEGVYRVAGAPPTPEQRLLAAVLAVGPDAVASHRSAAWLWGLARFTPHALEVAVARPRHPRPDGVLVHRSTDLVPRHTTVTRGIRVTTPARTVVDLGAVVPPPTVVRAMEQWASERLLSVVEVEVLRDEVGRQGRRGAGVVREILEARALGTEDPDSAAEAVMAELLRDAGLPVVFHHEVRDGDRFVAEVDFAFPELKAYLEVDGLPSRSGEVAFERDRYRQNALSALGWMPIRVPAKDVTRRPRTCVNAVRRVLAQRAAEFLVPSPPAEGR